jgi:hypothetical protein
MIGLMLEPGDVRKRLRQTMEFVKKQAAARRAATAEIGRDYDRFLEERATPVMRYLAQALRGEGLPFVIETPAGRVRLASERSKDDYLEVALDASKYPPVVVGRSNYVRGNEVTATEQPIREGVAVRDLTDEHVLDWTMRVIAPFVER